MIINFIYLIIFLHNDHNTKVFETLFEDVGVKVAYKTKQSHRILYLPMVHRSSFQQLVGLHFLHVFLDSSKFPVLSLKFSNEGKLPIIRTTKSMQRWSSIVVFKVEVCLKESKENYLIRIPANLRFLLVMSLLGGSHPIISTISEFQTISNNSKQF